MNSQDIISIPLISESIPRSFVLPIIGGSCNPAEPIDADYLIECCGDIGKVPFIPSIKFKFIC